VGEAAQFRAARADGQLEGYPDPDGLIGEAIRDGTARPPHGRVLVTHLGVGLADLLFAGAVLARAAEEGRGLVLPR